MADAAVSIEMLELTAKIVSAHLANNSVETSQLPGLIHDVFRTLSGMGGEKVAAAPEAAPVQERRQPFVPVKKSIFPDYIVCLEDGKKLKMLKRHLKTAYNLTPDQYRERWGLAAEYPMVAPNYASHRSSLAKKIGLGTKPRATPRRG